MVLDTHINFLNTNMYIVWYDCAVRILEPCQSYLMRSFVSQPKTSKIYVETHL